MVSWRLRTARHLKGLRDRAVSRTGLEKPKAGESSVAKLRFELLVPGLALTLGLWCAKVASADDAGAPAAAALFAEHCAACHGEDGAGVAGLAPNLTDDAWIWGGDPETIYETIAYGVRVEGFFARASEMPRFGEDGLLDAAAIAEVAAYVAALDDPAQLAAHEAGREIYANQCEECHGEAGDGLQAIGAPRLWGGGGLYGGSVEQIAAQVANPQYGVMPAWLETLGEDAVRALAAHVSTLASGR